MVSRLAEATDRAQIRTWVGGMASRRGPRMAHSYPARVGRVMDLLPKTLNALSRRLKLSSKKDVERLAKLPAPRTSDLSLVANQLFKLKDVGGLSLMIDAVNAERSCKGRGMAYENFDVKDLYGLRLRVHLLNSEYLMVMSRFLEDSPVGSDRKVGDNQRPTRSMCWSVLLASGRAGRGMDARRFFDKLGPTFGLEVSPADVAVLLRSVLQSGDEVGAIDILSQIPLSDLPRHDKVCEDVVQAYGRAFGSEEAIYMALDMLRLGWRMSPKVADELLRVCASSGDHEGAQSVWERMQFAGVPPAEESVVFYSESITLGGLEPEEVANRVLGKGEGNEMSVLPSAIAAGIGRARLAAGDPQAALDVLLPAIEEDPLPMAVASAVRAYGALQDEINARRLHDIRPDSPLVAKALIVAMAECGQEGKALALARQYTSKRPFDLELIGSLMQHAGSKEPWIERRVWQLLRPPFTRDCAMAFRGLLLGTSRTGDLDRAVKAATDMIERSGAIPSQRLLASAVANCRNPSELAEKFLENGIPITAKVFNAVLDLQDTRKGVEQVLSDMDRLEVDRDANTFAVLVRLEAENGNLETAMEILEEVETKGIIGPAPYTAVMELLALNGLVQECWNVIVRMDRAGIDADPSSYRALARAVMEEGSFTPEQAIEFFRASIAKDSVMLDPELIFAEMKKISLAMGVDSDLQVALEIDEERELTPAERIEQLRDIAPRRDVDILKRNYSNPEVVVINRQRMLGVRSKAFQQHIDGQTPDEIDLDTSGMDSAGGSAENHAYEDGG